MKQKPVLEMWPKPSVNIRLFGSYCSQKLMNVGLNKSRIIISIWETAHILLEKSDKILWSHQWFPHEIKRPWNKHRNFILMTYHLSRLCFWLLVPCGKFVLNKEKYFLNLGSDMSSIWNFCTPSSDVVLLHLKISAGFFGKQNHCSMESCSGNVELN